MPVEGFNNLFAKHAFVQQSALSVQSHNSCVATFVPSTASSWIIWPVILALSASTLQVDDACVLANNWLWSKPALSHQQNKKHTMRFKDSMAVQAGSPTGVPMLHLFCGPGGQTPAVPLHVQVSCDWVIRLCSRLPDHVASETLLGSC